ncbi:hypothetical protein Vretifemale_10876, partial [Volvox reticuliferus]
VAAALVVAAALAKEIGITMLGCMIAADVVLVPVVVTGSYDDHHTTQSDAFCCGGAAAAVAAAAAAAASPPAPPSFLRRFYRLVSWAVAEEPKCMRIAALAVVGVGYVRLRSWVAVDQLVRIYRKVENPIAFSQSPLERLLSTGHLHARYAGLLLWPLHLSADWSFECVPMISRLSDLRNALTAALYTYLTVVLIAARPWGLVTTWCRAAAAVMAAGQEESGGKKAAAKTKEEEEEEEALRLWAARWRLFVVAGLFVGPFVPASNVLFYVGTFIGERLLYFPSIGFCLLVSELLSGVLLWAAGDNEATGDTQPPTRVAAAEGAATADSASAGARASGQSGGEADTGDGASVGVAAAAGGPAAADGTIAGQCPSRGSSAVRAGGGCAATRDRLVAMRRIRTAATYAVIAAVLVFYAVRTWQRNWDWRTEEALFESAGRVCPTSAKVQLNLGILQRRRGDQSAALRHFRRARTIEPGYCEPGYWIGISLVNSGDPQSGVVELESALGCKYVAADALKALHTIYSVLHSNSPKDPNHVLGWGRLLLRPELRQLAQGCDTVERAALMAAQLGDVQGVASAVHLCKEALQQQQLRDELLVGLRGRDTGEAEAGGPGLVSDALTPVSPADGPEGPMQRCLEARRPVYHAIATAVSLGRRLSDSPRVLAQMYKYVRQLDTMPYCRLSSSSSSAYPLEGTATATPAHMHLIHTIQSTSPEDPWLQAEWGRTLNAVGRTQEASVHLSVAAMLLNRELPRLQTGQGSAVRSLAAGGGAPVGATEALEGIATALEDTARLRQGKECELWGQVLETRRMLATIAGGERPGGGEAREVARHLAAAWEAEAEMRRRRPPCETSV